MQVLRGLLQGASAVLSVSYPFWILWGLSTGRLEEAALGLLALSAVKTAAARRMTAEASIGALLAACALFFDSKEMLKFYPVVVNASLLALFAASLFSVPIVEKFARVKAPDLTARAAAWCRKVTIAWCVFFVVNGSVAAATTFMSDEAWTAWNGAASYVLMGLMFAGERILRGIKINKGG